MMNISLIIYGVIGWLIYDTFFKEDESGKYSGTIPIGQTLSYPPYVYKEMVNKLLNAMHGAGTEEVDIYQVFSALKTNDDAKQLKSEFGLRPYTGLIGSFGLLLNDSVDLSFWLNEELDDAQKKHLRKILSNNGITEYFI